MVQSIEDSSLRKFSNHINCRRSQISYILYIKFPRGFFIGNKYIKTLIQVSIKVRRIIGTLYRVSILNVNQYVVSTEILYFLGLISYFSVMPKILPLSALSWKKIIYALFGRRAEAAAQRCSVKMVFIEIS